MNHVPNRFVASFLYLTLLMAQSSFSASNDSTRIIAAGEALSHEKLETSFSEFISLFLIVDPHPDRKINQFINKARNGDADSFAFVCFLVWKGYPGFLGDPLSSKLGLMKIVRMGNAQAAFWIAQSFVQDELSNGERKTENSLSALHWLGISAGLGEERAHKMAMKFIQESSQGDRELETRLNSVYNQGLVESQEYRQ